MRKEISFIMMTVRGMKKSHFRVELFKYIVINYLSTVRPLNNNIEMK